MEKINDYEQQNDKWKYLLLLINPFIAYVYSFFTLREKSSLRIMFFFFVLFGFSLVVTLSNPDDCSRYLEEYMQFSNNPKNNFIIVWEDFWSGQDFRTVKDIYVYVLFYISSFLLPGNYHLVWGIGAMIFAFFYVKSLYFITKSDCFHNSWPIIMLTLIFMFSNPIYNVNSIRFFTASWMAVYATLKWLVEKKHSYILLLALTPFVHSTFIIYISFAVISILIQRIGIKPLTVLLVISFVFSSLILGLIGEIQGYLPPILQNQIWSYVESEGAQNVISGEKFNQLPLYARIFTRLPHYYEFFLLILLIINYDNLNDNSRPFLRFVVAYYSLVNFISIIPSCGRFYTATIPFIVFIWITNYNHLFKYKKILLYAPLVYSYALLYWVRKMIVVVDPTLFIFPYPMQLIKTLFLAWE